MEESAIRQDEQQVVEWTARAESVTISDANGYGLANEMLCGAGKLIKEIEAHHNPGIKGAHDLHRQLIATRDSVLKPLKAAMATLKTTMGAWNRKQLEIKREAERKAEAERKEAERLAAEAERRKQAAQEEHDAAAIGEAEADIRDYEELAEEAAAEERAISLQQTAPVVKGSSARTFWNYEVNDLGDVPDRFLKPRQLAVSLVKAHIAANGNSIPIPGIRIFEDSEVRMTGR